ncbi:hypothetical protein FRD01_21255 [Microvenator marinus]|uniref:Uncharacterized protein n=1 Tax=Microvenator marinus TaxID=2600177 RepID=A0A5B8XW02_9DELT|nr:hypothetical protein [Microvenator marinus]QED29720.1 hypothetical protein FRD01_21255 [Microvenator marinus]
MRNFSILMFWCFATACGNTDSDEVSPAPGTNNTNNVTVGTSNNSTTVQNNSSNNASNGVSNQTTAPVIQEP